MKTIEERANEAGIISQYKSDYRYDKKSVELGYTQGAAEQKAIDINKACEWMTNFKTGNGEFSLYGFVRNLRKTMGEQL